jgi:TRAP-type C4-dicarboxylate transport system permease small subunit
VHAAFAFAKRLDRALGQVEEAMGIVLVALLGIVVNLQIFARYLFSSPFMWPEEAARLIMVWIAFVGAAALTRRGADMAVDTFVLLMPPRWQRRFGLAKDAVMAVLFVFVALQGYKLAVAVAGMPLIALGLPTAMLAWPLVIGGGLIAFHSAMRVLRVAVLGEELAPEIKALT